MTGWTDEEGRIARAIYPRMIMGGDYDAVPIDEAFRRPRYQHLRERALAIARDVLSAPPSPSALDAGIEAAAQWHDDFAEDITEAGGDDIDVIRHRCYAQQIRALKSSPPD